MSPAPTPSPVLEPSHAPSGPESATAHPAPTCPTGKHLETPAPILTPGALDLIESIPSKVEENLSAFRSNYEATHHRCPNAAEEAEFLLKDTSTT